MATDYEALGKYTEATDQARKTCKEYNQALKALMSALHSAEGYQFSDAQYLPGFDAVALRKQFDEVAELHAKLTALCHEANLHAAKCDKPVFKRHISGPGIAVQV